MMIFIIGWVLFMVPSDMAVDKSSKHSKQVSIKFNQAINDRKAFNKMFGQKYKQYRLKLDSNEKTKQELQTLLESKRTYYEAHENKMDGYERDFEFSNTIFNNTIIFYRNLTGIIIIVILTLLGYLIPFYGKFDIIYLSLPLAIDLLATSPIPMFERNVVWLLVAVVCYLGAVYFKKRNKRVRK